ncbi:hypothetical protein [Lacimicrobium sp. SS2-24]|uniref:hypothetical protein n=1 Tax=Lacimicrobium sp. SS2-24 TaxID=2005569 RepID=UPI000B4A622A|nr:hypothetical protein [Lacimicrobium sp. SS2-24]
MKKLLLIILALGLFETAMVSAHGLNITTATMTLRQKDHLSVRVATSLTALFQRMQWQGKPLSIAHLVADESKMVEFHQQLVKMFSQELVIAVDGQPLESRQTRLLNIAQLRQQLQDEIATAVLPGHTDHHKQDTHGRYHDLVINIDGFIPAAGQLKDLQIDFPIELGPIMTSYSEPKIQTLAAGQQTTRYHLQLR